MQNIDNVALSLHCACVNPRVCRKLGGFQQADPPPYLSWTAFKNTINFSQYCQVRLPVEKLINSLLKLCKRTRGWIKLQEKLVASVVSTIMAVADSSTLYSSLSPMHFSDFTPSRVTRPSSNPFLQEHDPVSNLYDLVRNRDRSHSAMVCGNNVPLKGRYVDVEFAASFPPVGSRSPGEKKVEIYEEVRKHSKSDPPAYFNPLCTRKRSESKRTAFRKKQTDSEDSEEPDGDVMKTMETPTFVVFESTNISRGSNGVHSPPSKPFKSAPLGLPTVNKIKLKKRRLSPPSTPPPPPPPPPEVAFIAEPVESTAVSLQRGDQTTGMIESGVSGFAAGSSYVVLHRVDGELASDANCAAISAHERATAAERTEWQPPRNASSAGSPAERYSSGSSPPVCRQREEEESHSDSEDGLTSSTDCDSDGDSGGPIDIATEPIPIPTVRRHKLLSRYTPSPPLWPAGQSLPSGRVPLAATTPPLSSPPLLQNGGTTSPPPLSPPQFSPLPSSSAPQFSPPPLIGKTRPVPPPRQRSISQAGSIRYSPDGRTLKAMHSSPAILSEGRLRTASFFQSKAGEDCGQYAADYLGCREIDCYIGCVDQVAKQLVDSKSVEVIAYVTSEKVRLAPPKSSALLFKSFAMKDILSVEKCSKNKRIVGVLVWKSRGIPSCHILRCPTHIIANSLYETIWFQSQNIDEVMLSKIRTPVAPSHLPRPPSDISSSDSSCEGSAPQTPPLARDTPLSPTELLHKFPATHIGSAVAGKLHSVNEVIQKVLSVNKPTHAKEVCMWLSLAQVRLVDMSDESEIIYAMHETSRIRAIGVYSCDKRFIGYIIKEAGKPLTGHVLRCNSAGLMVSLMSFLRQSCQITFYQRGGSFYDELSTDDSEEFDFNPESSSGCESPGIIKRLRSLTVSHRPAITHQPSFVLHAPLLRQLSPAHDLPQRKRDFVHTPFTHSHPPSVLSPQEYPEDDYAKFTVNYAGSAVLDRPLSQQSILDALRAFEEAGVAGGQAAVQKNVIHMQVSALGINLTDKKHRLFISRNYPRKQLEGYCLHPTEPRCFAFASKRPGFVHSIKCHVFRQVQEPTRQIMDAIRFWLELEPVVSELDPVTS